MAKRPRSEAQRAASRANGRLSRGPKSVEGKNRSRRSALRHGLRATSLRMLHPAAGPDAAVMVDEMRRQLAPRDVIETEYVEGIAMAFWRLRRARQLEEALMAGSQGQKSDSGLAKALLERTDPAGALALLLRYRNQALGEVNRLSALLHTHRRATAAAALESEEAGRASPPGAAPAAPAAAPAAPTAAPAANDNRSAAVVETTPPHDRPLS